MCSTEHTQAQSCSVTTQLLRSLHWTEHSCPWGMCESRTACPISRNASQKKKAVAIAANKTVSISATNSVARQPLNGYRHRLVAQASHNDTAASDNVFPFPIHYILIPRPTLHMLVDLAMCSQCLHFTHTEESPLHPVHGGESPLHPPQRRVLLVLLCQLPVYQLAALSW